MAMQGLAHRPSGTFLSIFFCRRQRVNSAESNKVNHKEIGGSIMKTRLTILLAVICVVFMGSQFLSATTPGTAQNVQLVGQNPLFGRGMNAAATIFDHFLYVGNRTDGSSRCGIGDPRRTTTGLNSCPHPNPGVLVLDIKNPAAPTFLNEFGDEFTTGTFAGQTSRELRVWPEQKLLMIMYFRCSSIIHACTRPATNDWRIRFFALSDPVHPLLVSTYFLRLSRTRCFCGRIPTTETGPCCFSRPRTSLQI